MKTKKFCPLGGKSKNLKTWKHGFTLIEAMVFLFIFSLIAVTFYSVFSSGLGYAIESKNRIYALELANEKMEIIRSLSYENIGTINGIPSGTIQETEDVVSGGKIFHVRTLAQFIDDSFDGILPADPIASDYKRVKITVSWEGFKGVERSVFLVSNFTPPGLEVNSGDGILAIRISNGAGTGVSQALVHIVNNDISPNVDISQNTDNNGNLMFPGAKESQQGYQLTVSKSGYETVSTVDPNSVNYVPKDPNASVIKGLFNPAIITIDKLADLKIKSIDNLGNSLPGLSFHIKGGRELGTDSSVIPPEIIYDLDSNETTGSSGEKNFNDRSPGGQFFLSDVGTISGYTLIGASPIFGFEISTKTYEFPLLPEESKTIDIKFANDGTDSLLVKVANKEDGSRISGAEVRLTNTSGFESSMTTSFDGIAFFPQNSDPLIPGEYTLEINYPDFQEYSETVDISELTSKEIELNPQ